MKLTALFVVLFASVAVAAPQGRGRGKKKPRHAPVHAAPAKVKAAPRPAPVNFPPPAQPATPPLGSAALPPLKTATPPPAKRDDEPKSADLADDKPSTYFGACDYDRNGWISFRESAEALTLDRNSFAVYDADHDGRITQEEFEARYTEVRERTGGFRPPRAKVAEKLVPTRNAEQLRNAYDLSGDSALDLDELNKLLNDYERTEVPADVVLDKLDRDESGELEGQELVLFAELLSATYTPELAIIDPADSPKSIDALFGQITPREQGYQTTPQPPQIVGPVPIFRRLDLDNDGGVTLSDLEGLRAAMQLSVRTTAVFAALDTDQDGKLTEAELLDSMRAPRE